MNTTHVRLSIETQAWNGIVDKRTGKLKDWGCDEVYLTDEGDGWVLVINGTPGRWLLRSLLEGTQPSKVWIDMGQQWAWNNPQEVISDAVMTLLELARGV